MATAYTTGLRLAEPTPGDPAVANVWGTILNGDFTAIDTAITGTLELSVAGSANVVLTANNGSPDQARNANFVFSGVLTGNIYVLWPNNGQGTFSVRNDTTGAFTLSAAVDNGSGAPKGDAVIIPQGGSLTIVTDATDARKRVDIVGLGAASSGANSDITSLTGLTTPLTVGQGGTGNATGAPSGAAGGDLSGSYPNPTVSGSVKNLNAQVFTGSGTFTVPAGATTSSKFKFTVVGGGGGAGSGTGSNNDPGSGGGSGGAGWAIFSGFTAAENVTINIGAGGAVATVGGDTTVVANAATLITAGGGGGGAAWAGTAATQVGGDPGSFSATTAGGRTLAASATLGAQPGSAGMSIGASPIQTGAGGGNPLGAGGKNSLAANNTSITGVAGVRGGGGSGGNRNGLGGVGGNGVVIVEWVL